MIWAWQQLPLLIESPFCGVVTDLTFFIKKCVDWQV